MPREMRLDRGLSWLFRSVIDERVYVVAVNQLNVNGLLP
jgi:hypothetical protein